MNGQGQGYTTFISFSPNELHDVTDMTTNQQLQIKIFVGHDLKLQPHSDHLPNTGLCSCATGLSRHLQCSPVALHAGRHRHPGLAVC